jgi:hypothetical protein
VPHAVFLALIGTQDADVFQTSDPDPLVGEQFGVLIHMGQEHRAEIPDVLFEAVVSLVEQSTDAEGVRREAGAAIFLEDLERFLALTEAVEHRRDGADIQCVGSQPQKVAGDAIQLRKDHADALRPRGRFHVENFLHGQAVA